MPAVVCTTCGKKFRASRESIAHCPSCFTPVGPPTELHGVPQGDGWLYQVMGQEIGPVSFTELQQLARDGKISPETQVRRAQGTRWLLAERVSGLFDFSEGRAEWFFTHEGKRLGPVSYAMLRKLIVARQLASSDLLWQSGWPKAVSVGQCIAENLLMLPPEEMLALNAPEEIAFTCSACRDTYVVDGSLAGKQVLCRSCHQPGTVKA
jgi:hypothetical protein